MYKIKQTKKEETQASEYHRMTAVEQISAIMNVVATQHQSSQRMMHNNNSQQQRPSSACSLNGKSQTGNNKSEMDLFKLLERANLNQYLAMFTEQGNFESKQIEG